MQGTTFHSIHWVVGRAGLVGFLLVAGAVVFGWPAAGAQEPAADGSPFLAQALADQAPAGNAGLFVGVTTFAEDAGLSSLPLCADDAVETAFVFVEELRLVPAKQCVILISSEPVHQRVRAQLARLKQLGVTVSTANGTRILKESRRLSEVADNGAHFLVMSFSSHGFEADGEAYIMPSDGDRTLLARSAVPLQAIEDDLHASKAGHKLLLADACQERVVTKGGGGRPAAEEFIQAMIRPTGQAVFLSCSSGEFSLIDENAGHSLFTLFLLQGLRGKAAANDDGLIRLDAVANYVASEVEGWTRRYEHPLQRPFLKSPVSTRSMPLARRADDVETIIRRLEGHALAGGVTAELRKLLIARLRKSDPAQPEPAAILRTTTQYLDGQIAPEVFAGYLTSLLVRVERQAPPTVKPKVPSASPPPRALTNSIGMRLVLIPAGNFVMGSTQTQVSAAEGMDAGLPEGFLNDELPRHRVTISRAFYLGTTEVTRGQFAAFVKAKKYLTGAESDEFGGWGMGKDDATPLQDPAYNWKWTNFPQTDEHPVVNVSWFDAVAFCEWLSGQEKRTYRLPTEAEWEYACRAETNTAFQNGDDPEGVARVGNVADATAQQTIPQFGGPAVLKSQDGYAHTAPVRQYGANSFGLFDMHGNVLEWCSDWYGGNYYGESPEQNPIGPAAGSERVYRGGCWNYTAVYARAAHRGSTLPQRRDMVLGFRVVCEVPAP